MLEAAIVTSKLNRKLTKQDCVVADASCCSRFVLWEDDVGKLQVEKCYKIENVAVRSFMSVKYLSLSERAVIEEISDIGEVASVSNDDQLFRPGKVIEGEIVGAKGDEYRSCISCKGRVRICTDLVGECTRCAMKIKLLKCAVKETAQVSIQTETGERRTVMFFSEQLQALIANATGSTTLDKLLSIDRIRATVDRNDVVISAIVL